MAKSKAKMNRKWVTRALIGFVIVLGLLVFFSNTIMNMTIPKVVGAYCSRGNLSYTNSSTGTIDITNKTVVVGIEGREIEKVLLRDYDYVNEGDTILTLKPAADEETIKGLQEQLDGLLKEKEYADRQPVDPTDYTSYREAITMAEEALKEANETLTKATNKDATIAEATATINSKQPTKVVLEAEVAAASTTLEGLQAEISAIDSQIETIDENINIYVLMGTPTPTPTVVPGSDESSYMSAITYDVTDVPSPDAEEPTEEPTVEPTEEPTTVPTEEPTTEPTEEPTEVPTEEPTTAPTEEPTEVPTEEPTEVPTEAPTPSPVPTEIPTPSPTPEPDRSAMDELFKEKEELLTRRGELESQIDDAQGRLDEAAGELAIINGEIEDAQLVIEEANNLPSVTSAQSAVNTAASNLAAAKRALTNAQINDGIQADQTQDAIDKRDEQIKDLEKQIEDIKKEGEILEIKATSSGMIYGINAVSDGDAMIKDQVVCNIIPDYRECEVTFTFAASVVDNLMWVGQNLSTADGNYWVKNVTIINIKPNPDNPREERLVKCSVDCDYAYPGEQVTVIADRANSNYDHVISSSAINEDNSGNFVYVIIESSSPLGDKYEVKRVNVTIEATDGSLSAIKGEGLDGVQIVTRSEEPLHDGDRVRLEDYSK